MALLFHATSYSPDRARAEIQKLLLTIGARRISHEYSGTAQAPKVTAVSFTLATAHGEQEFMLPARADRVLQTLAKQGVLRGGGRRPDLTVQLVHAEAVAWRTLLEWLKVQSALIETEQAEAAEVMLPYMLLPSADDGDGPMRTFYEQFNQTRALPSGAKQR